MMLSKWRLKESRLLSEGRRGLPREIGDLRPPCELDDASTGLKGKQTPDFKGSGADHIVSFIEYWMKSARQEVLQTACVLIS